MIKKLVLAVTLLFGATSLTAQTVEELKASQKRLYCCHTR